MPVESDCEDQGFTTFDFGCTVCPPEFVNGEPVRQRIGRRGEWMCCVKCGGSYGSAIDGVNLPDGAKHG